MPLPRTIAPMLARLVDEPFDGEEWQFEVKWDGLRTIAFRDARTTTRLQARRGGLVTERYPAIVTALAALPHGCVVDGEIIVLDEAGKPSFERALRRGGPARFVAFDLLWHQGTEITDRPLDERAARLARLLEPARCAALELSEPIVGDGRALFRAVTDRGLEGIVAKRRDSRYLPGTRSDAWLKVKKHETIWCAVIGYLTDNDVVPQRGRDLRSLLIAAPRPDDASGALHSIGRVGAALPAAARARLLSALRTMPTKAPVIPVDGHAAWVEPRVFVEVRFLEWSSAGQLRAPVLQRWRIVEPDR